jgi:6-phosphofructo-2-kinase / fructose-2,6-biphosphatase 4
MEVRNTSGYLASRIVFYLMNLHTQRGTIYFARAGGSKNATYKSDEALTPEGFQYAKLLADRLLSFREEERATELAQGGKPRPLTVTSHTGFS